MNDRRDWLRCRLLERVRLDLCLRDLQRRGRRWGRSFLFEPHFDVPQHGQTRFCIVQHVPGLGTSGFDGLHVVFDAEGEYAMYSFSYGDSSLMSLSIFEYTDASHETMKGIWQYDENEQIDEDTADIADLILNTINPDGLPLT